MELKIYNRSGELKLTVSTSSSSTWNQELMKEYSVSVSFTHPSYVMLDVEDYVLLEGVKFSIKKEYKPRQKDTQTYSYSVKFYAPIHDAEQVKYLHLTDGAYNPQFSLDGGPREHLQKWVENMNRIYGREVWSIGDVVVADNRTIEYNNVTCWDAATMIAEAFGTEWWTDGFTFNLSRCEHGEPVELGYMRGLTSLAQSENSDSVKFFTRLIPLGSTKNIDPSRYGFSRLQLPDRSKYVDRNTNYGLYEHVEEDAFAGIFPHYTGSVTAVRSEEKTGEDGYKFTVYYFKDSGMAFDPSSKENQIAGLVKHISFQTGELAGRDFEVNYDSKTKEWEIINIYPDEKIQIPGGNLIPAIGDKYIPWNFRMPVEYEKQAELDYKAAVDDYLAKYSDDISKYGGDTDYIYIDKHAVSLIPGQRVRLLSDKYFSASNGQKDTRMTKVVRKLDNLSMATIECTNQVGKGWKKQVDSDIDQLKYVINEKMAQTFIEVLKTWDMKEPSNYNVFSALRSRAEFLSKKHPDQTEYLMKFFAGLECGGFNQGSTGVGIYKDDAGNWHIETDYLDVRMKFTATTVEIQKAYHIGGQQIKSAAAMKCVRVEGLADRYRCYMNTVDDDGNEITNDFRVNDQAYVNTFNLIKQSDGKTGNHFLWRLVIAVGDNYIDLSKSQCASGSDAPLAGDNIVLLGYQGTDDASRQVAVIDAGAGNGAPYYRQFVGINSFNLPAPETQLKPGDNELSGRLHIEKGSTGWQNMDGLPEEIQAAADLAQKAQDAIDNANVGAVNLLRNSGFTGDYETENLASNTALNPGTEMYSKALLHWSGTTTVQDDNAATSGRSVTLGELSQTVSLLTGESYVISYKAKGTSVNVSCGDFTVVQDVTSAYKRYVHKFTSSGSGTFKIGGIATICDLQLERGTIATDWKPSPLDNDKAMAEFQAIRYIADAIKNGSVDILNGLILATIIQLGNYKNGKLQKVTAGISGIYNDDDDVYSWGGGTLEQAIRTVMMYKTNPRYQPTDAELKTMANIVLTHGGRAILNDVIVRGYVYALGGFFHGTLDVADGGTHIDEDGTGWIGRLADGCFAKWDAAGNGSLCFGNIVWDAVAGLLTVNGKLNARGGSRLGNLTVNENGAQIGGNAVFEDISYIFGLPPITIETQEQIAARVRDCIINQIAKSTTILLSVNRGELNYRYTVNLPSRDDLGRNGISSEYGFRLTVIVTGSMFKIPGNPFDPINFNPTFRITSRPRNNDPFWGDDFPTGEMHDSNDNVVDYIDMNKGDVLELYYYNGIYYLLNRRS